MKTRILIFTALATALMAGCSKENGENPNPPEDMTGKAFLSLSLTSNTPAQVRAVSQNVEQPGTEDESTVTTVTVLLFDEMNNCLGAKDVSGLTISGGTPTTASDALKVPAATKKIFAVINAYTTGWDFTAATGKTWTELNTLLADAVIANVASNKNFMMASAGDLANGALTSVAPVKPKGNTQDAINAAINEAKANAVELKIDRLAAKVTVSVNGAVTVPTNAKFEFQGWNLNITNKSVRLYTDLVSYANATTGAAKGVYRKDNNYTVAEQPSGTDAMKAAFNYLTNGTGTDASGLSAVDNGAGKDLYCLENTMEAAAQQLGYTTKAVVKAKYAPEGFSLGDSYFFWNGAFFTLDGIKAAYLTHPEGTGLRADLPKFLLKAGIMTQSVFDGNLTGKDNAVAGLTSASFTATSGIVGRYCAVRYYHESVCYYDVLIRHDQNVTDKMALGKYGVVRNNWYGLQINSVSNPGTPWIPDPTDPEDPTKPDTPDDENDFYLSVSITVNPWTYWSQGVDLN